MPNNKSGNNGNIDDIFGGGSPQKKQDVPKDDFPGIYKYIIARYIWTTNFD